MIFQLWWDSLSFMPKLAICIISSLLILSALSIIICYDISDKPIKKLTDEDEHPSRHEPDYDKRLGDV